MFELIPECRIYFSRRNSTWPDCIFLSLLSHEKAGNNILLQSRALAAVQHARVTLAGGGGQTLLPVKRRLRRSVRGAQGKQLCQQLGARG